MPRTPGAEPPAAKPKVQGKERAIEDLLHAYPYLLEPGFTRLRRQVVLDATSRLDLLFEGDEEFVIIEIKEGCCGVAEVRQLERYLGLMATGNKQVRGILVGATLTAAADRERAGSRFAIAFRQTGVDVPLRVVVCRECCRARAAHQERCPRDGSREVIVS